MIFVAYRVKLSQNKHTEVVFRQIEVIFLTNYPQEIINRYCHKLLHMSTKNIKFHYYTTKSKANLRRMNILIVSVIDVLGAFKIILRH